MRLTFRQHDDFNEGDWYLIERAEHDGRWWCEPLGDNCFSLQCSARMGDADVEGPREHMLDIARAIRERKDCFHKRCGVRFDGVGCQARRPNSLRPRRSLLHLRDRGIRKV